MRHGSLNVDLLPRQTDQRHKSYTLEIVVQIRLHLSCSLLASAIYYSTKNAAAPPSLPLSSFLLRNLDLDSCLLVFGTRVGRDRSADPNDLATFRGTLDCGCKMQEERERKRKILTKIIFRQFRNFVSIPRDRIDSRSLLQRHQWKMTRGALYRHSPPLLTVAVLRWT